MKFFFCLIFCFKKRREKTFKTISKIMENKTDFFAHECFFTKRSETENRVFPTFFQESNNFFNSGSMKME